jgi:hypothetical protein
VDHLHSNGVVQLLVEPHFLDFLGAFDFSFLGRFSEAISFLVVSALPLFLVEGDIVIFFGTSTRSDALTARFQDFITLL